MCRVWHVDKYKIIFKLVINWTNEILQHTVVSSGPSRSGIIDARARYRAAARRLRNTGLRPRIFLTFGTTRMVVRQLYAPVAFTPEEIPGTHFQRLSRPQGTWFCRWEPRKKSAVTPTEIDPGTVRLVAQCLNHYATPGPNFSYYYQPFVSLIIHIMY